MGRGRQKAKHTKIARQLKSFSPDVNYDALEAELTGHSHGESDEYAKWADYEPGGETYDTYDTDDSSSTETPKHA